MHKTNTLEFLQSADRNREEKYNGSRIKNEKRRQSYHLGIWR